MITPLNPHISKQTIAKHSVYARFSFLSLGHFQDWNMRSPLFLAVSALLISVSGSALAQTQAPTLPAEAVNPAALPMYQAAPQAVQGYQQAYQQPSAYPQQAYPQAQQAYPQQAYPQPVQAPVATPYPVASPTGMAAPATPPSNLPPLPSDFQIGMQTVMPLSPAEIREMRRRLDSVQKAASEFPNPPRSQTGSVAVSLDPGSVPAVIRPFFGVSTSLVLVDSTGAAWPVENFVIGNKDLFTVERLDAGNGSSFVISPLQAHGQSNLILKLAGIPTPVVINLVLGQRVHDARVEARVQGRGPNALVSSASLAPGVDSRLLGVLDGVPPGGRELTIRSSDGRAANGSRAWMAPDGKMWMRTGLNIVSPAPLSFVSSSDGMRVYRLDPSAKILAMQDGAFVTLTMEGCLQECGSGSGDLRTGSDW